MIDWEDFYASFRKPDFIPGYEVQNHLGGGAFGEVYKAKKRSIGKAYAIKFLRLDGGAKEAAIERELEQVRLFASIDHPNLVTMEDMGVVHGVPYLIMGYAGEDTLARRLARRDLDRETALRYFVQVCRGVLALHDRRLAHFDLKPSNVFLKGDVARVGDYGLAKLLSDGRQTLSFGRGTPRYMAPEMLKNRADHRADVYSLGVILFESLTFELPFAELAETTDAVVVREDDSAPRFPGAFPLEMRPVAERCLRLDPADRFASVHELLEELGQTARQGDSVRFDWRSAPAEPGADPRAGDELRQAAAELARGAVGVARGVWSGVVDRVHPGEGDAAAEPALGGDVLSVSGLGEEAEPQAPEPGLAGAGLAERVRAEPVRAERVNAERVNAEPVNAEPVNAEPGSARRRPRFERSRRALESASMALDMRLDPAPLAPGGTAGTIPVPPRVAGGPLGDVVVCFALGAEIFGALLSGPVLAVLRGSLRSVDRIARGVPGALGRLLRFAAFLLLLSLLGALVSFVLLATLSLNL